MDVRIIAVVGRLVGAEEGDVDLLLAGVDGMDAEAVAG